MLEYVKGDLVNDNYSVIVHQVNCKGVMGAGLAKQIKTKYPFVFTEYKELCEESQSLLGHILISHASGFNSKLIVSMFAQDGYGRDKRYTDYEAFKNCLKTLARSMNCYSAEGHYNTIAFPNHIGCGLAGGDWNVIENMLAEFSKTVKQKVMIVSYE